MKWKFRLFDWVSFFFFRGSSVNLCEGEMFGSGSDSGQNHTGVAGAVLMPTRFVWPYGGRRVLLSGSFTRWQDHITMSPMEGCPTVFQVVCNLVPGYHQYKFFVDGEWCHDERQPVVSGNYGLVNTIFLPRESDTIPELLSPDVPAGSNMDVDNDFLRLDAVPQISQAEIELSRQRISAFLSTHTAYELLPESGKVIALDVNLPVKQAFHVLYEQLGTHGSNLTEEELETHSISAWKGGKLRINRQIDCNLNSYSRSLVHGGPYDSLKDLALRFLQNKVSTLPIIHSSSPDGSFPQLLHLATLSGILKCICRHFKHSSSSLPILQQPICSIPIGTWVPKIGESSGKPVAMLRPNASLGAALSLLVQAEVSAIPIVDDNDSLLDIYCRSDITALAKDRAYAQIRLDELSIHQAIQLGQDASSPHGLFNGQRCQMCLRSDPLHKVMERLAVPGARRLVIVEAGSKRVEGIISVTDVFRFLLGC